MCKKSKFVHKFLFFYIYILTFILHYDILILTSNIIFFNTYISIYLNDINLRGGKMRKEYVKFSDIGRSARIFSSTHQKYTLVDEHFHSEIELLRVDIGSIKCTANSSQYTLEEGDIVFINSYIPHSTEVYPGTRTSFIQFRIPTPENNLPYLLSRFSKTNGVSARIFHKNDYGAKEISTYISSILQENIHSGKEYDYKVIAYIYHIISLLYQHRLLIEDDKLINSDDILKITPVLEYINENYQENLTLDYLSNILNMHKNYFCRLFKKITGTTAIEYINFIRCYHAHKLLATELNITEISNTVGFSSVSYFNRTFKKFYYCSPSTYRNISRHKEGLGE